MYDTTGHPDVRSAFSAGDLDTASPSQVLVKCFDRLDLDLDRGLAAIEAEDHETANRELGHAQDLLGEVARMVDVEAWEHAGALLSIYDYVLRLIAVASMRKLPGPIVEAKRLLEEIGEGFRSAADVTEHHPVPVAAVPAASPFADQGEARSFSVLA